MKLHHLHEKAIDVKFDLQYVKDQLKAIKSQLVDNDIEFDRVLEILDDSFRPFGICFERSRKTEEQNDQHAVALDGAAFNPKNDRITVFVMRHLDDVLSDQYSFDDFASKFLILIGHELIHRKQAERSRVALKGNDPEKMKEYLSQKEEIMAYAHQAAHELVAAFGHDKMLASRITDPKLLPWSDALKLYSTHFEEGDPVRKRFLKYVVEYLL